MGPFPFLYCLFFESEDLQMLYNFFCSISVISIILFEIYFNLGLLFEIYILIHAETDYFKKMGYFTTESQKAEKQQF